ncbi:3277_t:CDS:10 [Paraglomus brasilianum]|uniref:Uridine kinase n=1 Tax=Paraglomus brasilianum TaxID=144538 RepID=A0A9N9GAJ2_9GLOM|nr:3277_t:CDS:10 [Paraglomus brasilianum]
MKTSSSGHATDEFFDHRNVSFVGRPFPLEEAHEHFARLRSWGLTFVRLLVPWEALEHAGPGNYDEEYIDHLVSIIEMMPRYGIKCFIDPHQDTWSRFSGGSGAPGWTFEVAGLDITKFQATGAAHIHNSQFHNDHLGPGSSQPMVWPTNYTKLASSTMFTLFWSGNTFAPELKYQGKQVQDFLQDCYLNCYSHLAERVQQLEAVIGFEVMNEPHQGYIGLVDLTRYSAVHTLVFGDSPSAFQSFTLGDGIPTEIEVWIRSWPYPTRKHSTRVVNTECESAWLNRRPCVWRQHGVWDVDEATKNPVLLQKEYFTKDPKTGNPVEFYKDFYLPFVNKYIKAIQSVKESYLVFVEPLPNEPPPVWTPTDNSHNVIYAPHWYDLKSVFNKAFDGLITHDVQSLSKGKNVISATYFGLKGAKNNYTGQVRDTVNKGLINVGEKPCVIGECGIPMDINEKKAFETGDYTHHSNFLDAVLCAMERNLVNFTLWNYNPTNDNTYGDHWNGEDFSIYSPLPKSKTNNSTTQTITITATPISADDKKMTKHRPAKKELKVQTMFENEREQRQERDADNKYGTEKSPTSPFELMQVHFWDQEDENDEDHYHHIGGRVLDAVLRPYASKVPGIPQVTHFNLQTLEYKFQFTNYPQGTHPFSSVSPSPLPSPEVEIYIPNYHYKQLHLDIRVSDGDWRYVRSRQTLYWRVKDWTTEGIEHSLRIRIVNNNNKQQGMGNWTVDVWNVWGLRMKRRFNRQDGKNFTPYLIAVAGGSASGKTSVAKRIIKNLNVPWVVLLSMDSYYKPLSPEQLDSAMNNDYNFDHPNAFDYEMLAQTLKDLKEGKRVEIPIYDFTTHSRRPETSTVYGANVVIFEGIFALYDKTITDLMDLKIFVDTDADIRLARRCKQESVAIYRPSALKRDINERGRDIHGVLKQYGRFVKSSFDDHILPTVKNADVVPIIPRGLENHVAIELITKNVQKQLAERKLSFRWDLARIEYDDDIPENVILLKATPQLKGIHTIIRDCTTARDDLIFYTERLATLVVERGLAELPFRHRKVTTPLNIVCDGKALDAQICGVSILRAGGTMETGLRRAIKDALIGKMLIQSDPQTGEPQLHYIKLPSTINQCHVFLMDAQIATGAAGLMAIRVLLDHNVPEDKIIFLTFLATIQGLHTISKAFPKVKLCTSMIDPKVNEHTLYIEPGMGNFGDRYFGTEP